MIYYLSNIIIGCDTQSMIETNKRRVPADKEFMENKGVYDLLYGLIQIESNWNDQELHRFIYKNKIKKSKWAKLCGVSRPTLNKVIDNLVNNGYLIDCGVYYQIPDKGEYYQLIPIETLKFLVNTSSNNTIKVFVILASLYKAYGNDAYFTQRSLLKTIGYSATYGANHKLIKNILTNLENNGFIKTYEEDLDGVCIKRISYFNPEPDEIKDTK